MEVTNIDEHKDGSATLHLECTDEEVDFLVQYVVITILKNKIKDMEKDN